MPANCRHQRWIVNSLGEIWLDPGFPDEPTCVCGAPTQPKDPSPIGHAEDSQRDDVAGEEAVSLSSEDFSIAALLARGRTHRQIGEEFSRGPKWVQRKLRANSAIEDVAEELRGQIFGSLAGRVIGGLDTPIQILQSKAGDPDHPEQLSASRLLMADGVRFHTQRVQERAYRHRIEELERLVSDLMERAEEENP